MGFIKEKFFGKLDQTPIENIEQFLVGTDEQIVLKTKPNKKAHIWESVLKNIGFVAIWGAMDIAALVAAFTIPQLQLWVALLIVGFVLVHMVPVWIWVAGIVKSVKQAQHSEYALTDKRVIIKTGKFAYDFRVIYYQDIESVEMQRNKIDKMCGVADIYIRTKTESVALANLSEIEELWKNLYTFVKQENPDAKI